MATLHLIGGGPNAMVQTRKHLHAAVDSLGKKKSLVAYVGAASGDNAGFRTMLGAAFLGSGARLEPANTVGKKAKISETRGLLGDCDLVFISGGDVEAGMQVLHDRDLVGFLVGLAKAGKPMMGISAGSIMLGQRWVRFPDEDESHAEPFDCLGIAPLQMDAHSEDDNWSELRVLVRLLGERGIDPALGYGVPSKGCLHVETKTGKLKAQGAPITRIGWKKSKLTDEKPLEP